MLRYRTSNHSKKQKVKFEKVTQKVKLKNALEGKGQPKLRIKRHVPDNCFKFRSRAIKKRNCLVFELFCLTEYK